MDEFPKPSGNQEHPADRTPDSRTEEQSNPAVPDMASKREFSLVSKGETFDELHMSLSGSVSVENAELLLTELLGILKSEPLKNLVVDLGEVQYFDSAGAAVMVQVRDRYLRERNSFTVKNASPRIQMLMDMPGTVGHGDPGILKPGSEAGVLVQIGERVEQIRSTSTEILIFIGASIIALKQDLWKIRNVKWDSLARLVERSGSDAVPIAATLSFLMGAILAFQAAIQLRKFGATIFVADLVSVSICLEMGPLLTALIVAGRSGAAFAAQIGTMQVTEEIDALRVMAIDPFRYLVSPRIVAVAFVLPLLTVIADIMGILGGCAVAALALDLTPVTYFDQVKSVLEVSDVLKGLTKSLIFGVEVAMVGCLRGFQVRGGAENVGAAATSAVVTSIFVLTVTDAVFAMLFHYVKIF